MSDVRHVLGISGGKDSAALAIHLRTKYPELNTEYYFCDTGKELDETYKLIDNLEDFLGKKVTRLEPEESTKAGKNPFDFYYNAYRGYLPSNMARWCTKKMKLEPFEKYVGVTPTISYVGIRGDEDREGYISTKRNIQSIFPFRKNIWSEEIIRAVLADESRNEIEDLYRDVSNGEVLDRIVKLIQHPIELRERNPEYNRKVTLNKLNDLLDRDIVLFNQVVFRYLKSRNFPLSFEDDYPLLYDDEILVRDDIFRLLRESDVGVPAYYEKMEYQVGGQKGEYARSRSGCFFCFFQQKIEWVWLYEQHPDLFIQAMEYENEKEGFTWNQNEPLSDLIHPSRIEGIKEEHLNRMNRKKSEGSKFLIDILDDTENEGCAACFI